MTCALEKSAQPPKISGNMPDIRKSVEKAMKKKGWTTYRLAQALKGKRPGGGTVPQVIVYDFLRGTTTINSGDLGLILDVLGLEIREKR